MNFLAHLYLSGDDEEIITGNFIADHVKGKAIQKFSPGIRTGIRFHREIDEFTDAHPVFLKSKGRLGLRYRKYAGVITDMFYDHFLSSTWNRYSHEPLEHFTNRMFAIINKRLDILPEKTKRLLPYMARDNWLMAYGTFEGLGRALRGMERRTPFDSGMGEAISDLKQDYDQYSEEFAAFFPDLREFCKIRLRDLLAENKT